MEPVLQFRIPVPKIGAGKKKNQLATINTLPYWYRYRKTIIKNEFKNRLLEWYIGKSNIMMESFKIEFSIIRNNKRKLDSDSIIMPIKWIIDVLVQQGYAKDDDKVKIVIIPSVVDLEQLETLIDVKVIKWKHE